MRKPFTHMVQWRKNGYWAPGPKFSSEEQAQSYAEVRAVPDKRGVFRVVPYPGIGELSVEQVLALMKLLHLQPVHWRIRLMDFIDRRRPPKGNWSDDELQTLQDIGERFPRPKLLKLTPEHLKSKLLIADARERAKDVVRGYENVIALDDNPEVMAIKEGAFVQAWVFVPKRTEEQEREHQHDIAAYLAGAGRADAA